VHRYKVFEIITLAASANANAGNTNANNNSQRNWPCHEKANIVYDAAWVHDAEQNNRSSRDV
jgi:hypothetical protein